MNPASASSSIFDFLGDPHFQSQVEELHQNMQDSHAEVHEQQQRMSAAIEHEKAQKPDPQPELDPEVQARWDQFAAQFGTNAQGVQGTLASAAEKVFNVFEIGKAEAHEGGVQWHELGEHLLEEAGEIATEHIAHQAKHHLAPPPLPKKTVQWFYALNYETQGPVSEDELLQLLNNGTVKRSSLVWNKTMSEWTKAADSPLAEKIEAAPPPLPKSPAKKQVKGKAASASVKCPACGFSADTTDRFCPECGKPMKP